LDVAANVTDDGGGMAKIIWHNERRAIRELIPYEVNPRQITDKQAKDLKASLAKFGIADPIIINTDNMIIGGHQRMKILETLLGYEPDFQIDVRVPDRELSIDEVRELNVRLNKNVAEWDFDTLANNFELDDLLDWGFDKKELDLDLWAGDAPEDVEPQIDKAEELRVKWGVESGQLWQLGEHRLICGDSTNSQTFKRLMDNERADLVYTDPPYGISFVGSNNPTALDWEPLENDNLRNDELYKFLTAAFKNMYENSADNTALYCWHAFINQTIFAEALLDSGYSLKQQLIWNKGMVLARSDYHWAHDPMYYCRKTGQKTQWYGDRTNKTILGMRKTDILKLKKEDLTQIVLNLLDTTTVWEIDRDTAITYQHSTQKPVRLAIRAITNSSDDNSIVLDPFIGSGTTIIACEQLGRKCRAIEISPAYCAVAIQRWVDMTGGVPELIDSNTII